MDDRQQFTDFYSDLAPALMRQLLPLTRDVAEAQDCIQEAFARAWQRWPAVSAHPSPEAWVRTVAHRYAVSRFRRTRNRLLAHSREAPSLSVPGVSPDYLVLIEAMRKLPLAQREAIVLHHLADLSVEEVATALGAPVGTIKARLSRGRLALRDLLGNEESAVAAVAGSSGNTTASASWPAKESS